MQLKVLLLSALHTIYYCVKAGRAWPRPIGLASIFGLKFGMAQNFDLISNVWQWLQIWSLQNIFCLTSIFKFVFIADDRPSLHQYTCTLSMLLLI